MAKWKNKDNIDFFYTVHSLDELLVQEGRRQEAGARREESLYSKLFNLFELVTYFRQPGLEQKQSHLAWGRIRMSPIVKLSLMALHGSLLLMAGLVFYCVLYLAGVLEYH